MPPVTHPKDPKDPRRTLGPKRLFSGWSTDPKASKKYPVRDGWEGESVATLGKCKDPQLEVGM